MNDKRHKKKFATTPIQIFYIVLAVQPPILGESSNGACRITRISVDF